MKEDHHERQQYRNKGKIKKKGRWTDRKADRESKRNKSREIKRNK